MRPARFVRFLLLSLLLLSSVAPTWAAGPDLAAASAWLKGKQVADGGFSDGFSANSSVSATTDAVIGAAAQGIDVSTWGQPSPLDYLATAAPTMKETGPLAKTILAAVATSQNPKSFAGTDLVAALQKQYDATTGAFKGLVNDHAFAMLALKAAGEAVPEQAAAALEKLQTSGGGWSFDAAGQADTNTTAVAVQALLAAGRTAESASVKKALDFLKTQQNSDGGFPYQTPNQYGTANDANSTAYVLQALQATGQTLSTWKNPETVLGTFQIAGGAFEYQTGQGANFLATAQAIPALAGYNFVRLPRVAAARTPVAGAQATAVPTATAAPATPAATATGAATTVATATVTGAATTVATATPAAMATAAAPTTLPTTGTPAPWGAMPLVMAGLTLLLLASGAAAWARRAG